ncbi:MAG: ERF family protein [Sporomusaceae bacterium]|nr:ERF family protein [Sporomusaceae bacterium]
MDQFFTGKAIAEKLLQLMAKIPYMQKDVDSKELRYKYLSYEAVSDRVQEEMVTLKIVSVPQFETIAESNYVTAKGATWKYVRSRVSLQVIDVETGEYCMTTCEGSGTDPGDKAVAKAQTMAMKNAWCKLLNIPIGNDPEADPVTDQQQFKPSVSFGLKGYEAEIIGVWRQSGWDPAGLPGWIQQRFQKAPTDLTVEECYAIYLEFYNYAQSKNGGQ